MTAPRPPATNRTLAQAWAELSRQIKGEALADVPRGVVGIQGTITAVGVPAADGRRYANFRWQGKTIQALCNADLTLAVGNLVVVHLYDTDPVIMARLTK